jgi:hypothetical protein
MNPRFNLRGDKVFFFYPIFLEGGDAEFLEHRMDDVQFLVDGSSFDIPPNVFNFFGLETTKVEVLACEKFDKGVKMFEFLI